MRFCMLVKPRITRIGRMRKEGRRASFLHACSAAADCAKRKGATRRREDERGGATRRKERRDRAVKADVAASRID